MVQAETVPPDPADKAVQAEIGDQVVIVAETEAEIVVETAAQAETAVPKVHPKSISKN